ncbi:MAG: methylase [Ferruginibacter sp.]|nr:methylase [Ferruginibacter sp.]
MSLFSQDRIENLLPRDGVVPYYGKIFSAEEANRYFQYLLQHISWKNDEAVIFGKHFITKRKVAWYAAKEFSYTYSGTSKTALPWTKELLQLKSITEQLTGEKYNSCLLNLYHDGDEGMAWHSDDEKSLGKNASIASLSFGAERKFCFKHKTTKEMVCLLLEHGSLLEMKGTTQANWWHRLPKTVKISTPRINLTFRSMAGA